MGGNGCHLCSLQVRLEGFLKIFIRYPDGSTVPVVMDRPGVWIAGTVVDMGDDWVILDPSIPPSQGRHAKEEDIT